ncbi:MAG: hypothetical protein ACPGSC_07640 [Granulosicoccaceae bacterium]
MKKLLLATLIFALIGCDESTQTTHGSTTNQDTSTQQPNIANENPAEPVDSSDDTHNANTGQEDSSAGASGEQNDGDTGKDSDTDNNSAAGEAGTQTETTTAGLWGECTSSEPLGRPLLPLPDNHNYSVDYTDTAIGRMNIYAGAQQGSPTEQPIFETLNNGCASDSHFSSIDTLHVYIDPDDKGLLLWLSQDSGAAIIEYAALAYDGRPYGGTRFVSFLQPAGEVKKPLFVSLQHDIWGLKITPIDEAKPVKISEIRSAGASLDVSTLRKNRFSASAPFAAANGDLRARVTAELAERFGSSYFNASEDRWEKSVNCGDHRWIDATWEIPSAVLIKDKTVMINWALATNTDIWSAIKQARDTGPGHWGWQCTPHTDDFIEQDWVSKSQEAQVGSFVGPELSLVHVH